MLTNARLSAYADAMIDAGPAADIAKNLDHRDPAVGLRSVAALRRLLEQLEALQVANARALGWSWQDIAEALGVTKQTVHRKHSRR
jgi:DNA-binding NarL/FixJ family response regulator